MTVELYVILVIAWIADGDGHVHHVIEKRKAVASKASHDGQNVFKMRSLCKIVDATWLVMIGLECKKVDHKRVKWVYNGLCQCRRLNCLPSS